MPIYNFKCLTCDEKYESIAKTDQEIEYCPVCKSIGRRVHGQDKTSPPKLIAGVGGFHSPSFGERKYG